LLQPHNRFWLTVCEAMVVELHDEYLALYTEGCKRKRYAFQRS